MSRTYKACIFDLDGTIANTIDTIEYYGNRSLEKFNLPTINKEKYKYLVGNGYKILVKRMLEETDSYSDELFDKISKYYHDDYETDSLYLTKLYDGIEDLIYTLKSNGILIGVLSNKPYGAVNDVINKMFRENTFDICCGQDGTFPLKPAPDGLIKIISDMELISEDCLYIGDTGIDIRTGKRVGVFTIGCEWGFRDRKELEENGADLIVSKPSEIIDFMGLVHIK